jgi:predicted heme/steroid binding protein
MHRHALAFIFLAAAATWGTHAADLVATGFLKTELAPFNGEAGAPIYLGLQGLVFDVSSSPHFYGPGAPYTSLAGRDSSRAITLMSLEPADLELEDDMSGISDAERQELKLIFEETYVRKYPIVGLITDSRAIPPGVPSGDWFAEVTGLSAEIGPARIQDL